MSDRIEAYFLMQPAYLLNLPRTDYRKALALQRDAVAARRDGRLDRDVIIMVEHPPVFTLGRRGGRENLLVSEQMLADRGMTVVSVERGGDITFHGPGQLVVYPLVDLSGGRFKVVAFVDAIEQAMVLAAAHWGVSAQGSRVNRGVWVQDRKLGSVGITVRRGITFHGLALNVATDLTPFEWINPCGIQACRMTNLSREAGRPVAMASVRREMAVHLEALLSLSLDAVDLGWFEANVLHKR